MPNGAPYSLDGETTEEIHGSHSEWLEKWKSKFGSPSEGTQYFALDEPPKLIVTSDSKSVEAVIGTTSWYSYEADSGPPPEMIEYQKGQMIIETNSAVSLKFDVEPIEYNVGIWGSTEQLKIEDGEFIVTSEQKGNLIFQVEARWKEGNATYAFAVNVN